ncbi:cytochrome P450 [Mycena pura]|uniref:Cytochrome P450 n=1 Tax=Mycena pura TaxID=153505 RepID=A0AAD6ULR8_9AGAR|nr:cytochrome P450 [Mycena pura]
MSYYAVCAAITVFLLLRLRSRRIRLPLPPGPKKLPFIGNLLDMPSTFQWETYMKWSQLYDSDIIHLNVAGSSIIVLSSLDAATELLEKRSNIYSDRSRMPMVKELMGWDWNIALMRRARRQFHRDFNIQAVRKYDPKLQAAAHGLLRRLLRDPENVIHHFRHMAGEAIMSAAYGITVLPENDPYIKLAEDALTTLFYAVIPGQFLVDSVPALMHLPNWFPGAGFKRIAKEWRQLSKAMVESPFAETKRKMAEGNATPSFVSTLLRDIEDSEDKHEEGQAVKEAAGAMYIGGADTTVSALASFVLAMLSNPEAQKKAQMEIDSVVGNGRLPDFTDAEESLPYLSALVKEVLRWRSVTPLGVPHFVSVEDEYRGYRIPANSLVISNLWAIHHDETLYPDPYEFKPERWLSESVGSMGTAEAAFGFGRRICPGRHFATSSVWITIACVLATLNITKAVDEDGTVIEPTHEYRSAMVIEPLPFKCSIKPRSEAAARLIQETVHGAENL